jgi:uncharacterized membrane protein required for colicin V production
MSLALDIVTLAVIAISIYYSYKKGLARSLIGLAGFIASFVAAAVLCVPVGNWIFLNILKPLVYDRISSYIAVSATGNAALAESLNASALSTFVANMPGNFVDFLSQYRLSLDSFKEMISSLLSSGTKEISNVISETVATPIAVSIGRGIAFVLLFTLCLFAVRLLANLSDLIFKLPVISILNSLGGVAIGFIKAAIIMFVISALITLSVPLLSLGENPAIKESDINSTRIYKVFHENNPVTGIFLKK